MTLCIISAIAIIVVVAVAIGLLLNQSYISRQKEITKLVEAGKVNWEIEKKEF